MSCPRVNGEDVRLMLWDTAGQEEFDAITRAYYRGNTLCFNLAEYEEKTTSLTLHEAVWTLGYL